MASGDITITIELRTCLANRKKALFHKWLTEDKIINDMKQERIKGLVEYEDGTLHLVSYKNIRFIDNKHKEYCWEER